MPADYALHMLTPICPACGRILERVSIENGSVARVPVGTCNPVQVRCTCNWEGLAVFFARQRDYEQDS